MSEYKMQKRTRLFLVSAIVATLAIWIWWWASWNFALEHQIHTCKEAPDDCSSYNIIFFSAWRLATVLNHWSNLITAVATAFVAWFTWTLWRASDELGKISAKTVDVAEKQMLLTGQQADIQKKQHAIGRLQFLASHRPRLRIRHVTLIDPFAEMFSDDPSWDDGDEVKGSMIVVNAGGTNATIVESRYRIFFTTRGLPAGAAPYDEKFQQLLLPDQVLEIGESCAIPLADKAEMPGQLAPTADSQTLRRFALENWEVYVMGQIRFRDEGGAERFMGFCRLRDADGRFHPVGDPDYEYED